MSTPVQHKADEIVENLQKVFATRNTLFIKEPLWQFLVRIFDFEPCDNLAEFQASLSDGAVVADKILGGKPKARVKHWCERFLRRKDEADRVVAETIELMAELSREFAVRTGEQDLVKHVLEAKTNDSSLRAVWNGVEVHASGADVWTVHDLGYSKLVVPLEGDHLTEFKKSYADLLPQRALPEQPSNQGQSTIRFRRATATHQCVTQFNQAA
jgi:hypothetical protein